MQAAGQQAAARCGRGGVRHCLTRMLCTAAGSHLVLLAGCVKDDELLCAKCTRQLNRLATGELELQCCRAACSLLCLLPRRRRVPLCVCAGCLCR
jgi:hypothetical protein